MHGIEQIIARNKPEQAVGLSPNYSIAGDQPGGVTVTRKSDGSYRYLKPIGAKDFLESLDAIIESTEPDKLRARIDVLCESVF